MQHERNGVVLLFMPGTGAVCETLWCILRSCLEWAPFYKGWLNVTQPYMKKFACKTE